MNVIKNDKLSGTYDVVVAVGIDLSKDGLHASPQSYAVALKAVEIYRRGLAKNVLLVGGYSVDGITEAEDMALKAYFQVPKHNLFKENKSKRTWLNADLSLPILRENNWESVIIVAQQWHARRVRATFKKRWPKNIHFSVIKAWSRYGGGSQKRLRCFLCFVIWDTLDFIFSKLKGYA